MSKGSKKQFKQFEMKSIEEACLIMRGVTAQKNCEKSAPKLWSTPRKENRQKTFLRSMENVTNLSIFS